MKTKNNKLQWKTTCTCQGARADLDRFVGFQVCVLHIAGRAATKQVGVQFAVVLARASDLKKTKDHLKLMMGEADVVRTVHHLG